MLEMLASFQKGFFALCDVGWGGGEDEGEDKWKVAGRVIRKCETCNPRMISRTYHLS